MQTQSKSPLTNLGLALASSLSAIAISNPAFNTSDSDQAFVSIGNAITVLSTSSSYGYTFGNAGNYQVAMGVLDVNDSTGVSTLTLSNAQVAAVPWETDLLPILGSTLILSIGYWGKRKLSQKQNKKRPDV